MAKNTKPTQAERRIAITARKPVLTKPAVTTVSAKNVAKSLESVFGMLSKVWLGFAQKRVEVLRTEMLTPSSVPTATECFCENVETHKGNFAQ